MNRFASMTSGRSRVALNLPAALLGLALILLGPDRAWAEPAQGPCVTLNEGTGSYAVCEVDLRRYRLQFFWKGPNGEPYGDLGALARALEAAGRPPVFVTNGGMYKPDLTPVGLYVQDGRELVRVNTMNGPGNFHLKPNGVFFVHGERAGVVETDRYLKERPRADFATQSGPMLVIKGRLHPKISEHGVSRKIRNGVGLRNPHTVVFAISNGPVTFGEFAHLFRDRLGCADALYLDGSISGLHAPSLGRTDGLLPLGPMIAAFRR
jgi:uncharacterized protein YigE (DUF2233 family)